MLHWTYIRQFFVQWHFRFSDVSFSVFDLGSFSGWFISFHGSFHNLIFFISAEFRTFSFTWYFLEIRNSDQRICRICRRGRGRCGREELHNQVSRSCTRHNSKQVKFVCTISYNLRKKVKFVSVRSDRWKPACPGPSWTSTSTPRTPAGPPSCAASSSSAGFLRPASQTGEKNHRQKRAQIRNREP